MDSKTRVWAAMTHKDVDRTPIFEYVLLSPVADAVLGRPFVSYDQDARMWLAAAREMGWETALERYAAERVEIAAALGHDLMYATHPPYSREGERGVQKRFEDPEDRLKQRNELAFERLCRPQDMRGYEVYAKLKDAMRRREAELCLMAPAYTLGIWADVDLMQTMLLAPEVAHRHFELAAQEALAQIEVYAGMGIRLIGVGGDFAGNRLLISPQAYREFIVPRVRGLAGRIHELGGFAVTASDGDVRPVLEAFLFDSGADAYLEIDSRAGMDMTMLKSRTKGRVCLMGNIDCGELLSFGTPKDIRKEVEACLDAGWGGGGHIFTASNAISATVPVSNYRAMHDAYRACFGMAPAKWG